MAKINIQYIVEPSDGDLWSSVKTSCQTLVDALENDPSVSNLVKDEDEILEKVTITAEKIEDIPV